MRTAFLFFTVLLSPFPLLQGFQLAFLRRFQSQKVSSTKLLDSIDDWRAFRAKLIERERTQEQREEDTTFSQQQQWIHEQTILEPGSVLIHTPRPQDIYGLGRQGLYKAAILILESDAEQTTGIILNRPTNLTMEDFGTAIVHYGGDENALHDVEQSFDVLLLNSNRRRDDSDDSTQELLPGLEITTVPMAQKWIRQREAHPDDFHIFCGRVSWPTQELQTELERGVWRCLSVDTGTLRQHITETDFCASSSSSLYKTLLSHTSATLPKTASCDFDERMFQEWSRWHLNDVMEDTDNDSMEQSPSLLVQSGDLLRTSSMDHAFLFSDQEFHKSLLLVIQEDDDFTIGVILSHPTQDTESMTGLPIRYGGNFRYLEDDSVMPPFCLHHLGGVVGGEAVGNSLYVFKASMEQAAAAIEQELATKDDFLVAQGMSVWPKDDFHGGIASGGCFEVVSPSLIPQVFKTLATQTPLCPLSLETNADIARQAWNSAAEDCRHGPECDSDGQLLDLGMDAIKTWLAAYLLEDSDYRP